MEHVESAVKTKLAKDDLTSEIVRQEQVSNPEVVKQEQVSDPEVVKQKQVSNPEVVKQELVSNSNKLGLCDHVNMFIKLSIYWSN